tara:strand:+ start:878 stop:1351 length:474 start_codon:yes stop_codon:yes gene_type:complete
MKNTIFIFFILYSFSSNSQSVIGSAGNTSYGNNTIISWTIGEVVISTVSSSEKILTQGFHQPLVIGVVQSLEKNLILDMMAYPNPTFDKILFKGGDPNGIYQIRLLDKLGRVLYQNSVNFNELELEMSKYQNGSYLIELVENNTDKRQFFNIVKTSE